MFLLEMLEQNPFLHSLQLPEASCLMAPVFIFKASNVRPCPSHSTISPLRRTLVIILGSHRKSRIIFPSEGHLTNLNFICNLNSSLPLTYSQVLDVTMWRFVGGAVIFPSILVVFVLFFTHLDYWLGSFLLRQFC